MQLTESISEILKHAIKSEVLARQYYQRTTKMTSDHRIRILFSNLADDEMRHESDLRSIYHMLVGEEAPEQIIQTSETIGFAISDAIGVLKTALEREERAKNYYRFLAVQADKEEAREILLRLESEEERHYDLIEMELKGRTGQIWPQPELSRWLRND
jgi:rubrerythrin